MKSRQGFCHLCKTHQTLCLSHALPESAFRLALREGSGKVVSISADANTPVHHSSDTWDIELLCLSCEGNLNKWYDGYGIAVLKGLAGTAQRGEHGVTFRKIDKQRLRMFILSVLWRISASNHNCYRNVVLPDQWAEELRRALLNGGKVSSSIFTVTIYRLHDSTSAGFEHESLRSIVVSPFARKFQNGILSICFVLFGFFIEVFLPKLPNRVLKKPGVFAGSSPVMMAPFIEILDIPELLELLTVGLMKHEAGLSNIRS